jgi:hypothetical protein
MPQPVVLDTLYISSGPFGQFKFASIAYTDPAGLVLKMATALFSM